MAESTTKPPERGSRLPRSRVVLIVALAVMLGIGAALAAAEASGWRFLRAPIEQRLGDAVGAPVHIDEGFELRLLRARPSIAMGRLQVGSRAGFEAPHLVAATQLRLSTSWRELWRWRGGEGLHLQSIAARTLDAHVIRRADGQANWRATAAATPPAPPASAPLSLQGLPRFGSVEIVQGRIEVDDRVYRTRLDIALSAANDAPAGAGPAFRAEVAGRLRDLPLRLSVRFAIGEGGEGGEGAGALPRVALRIEGEAGRSKLLFEGGIEPLSTSRRLDGDVRVQGPSLAAVGTPLGLTLPTTPPFELAGRLSQDGDVWRFAARRAVVGTSRLGGDFVFDRRPERAHLGGTLRGSRLAFADLGPAIGTGTRPPGEPSARVLPARRFDIPRLRAMDADVAMDVAELDFDSAALAPLRDVKARILLADGVLSIEQLRASVGRGRVSGSTRLDGRGEPALWAADLRFEGIEIEQWVRGVRKKEPPTTATPAAAAANAYLSGELLASIRVTGQGRSTAEILASMDGKARAMLRNGSLSHLVTELAGIDIAQSLGVAISGDKPLPLRCARVELQIDDGIATPTVAMLDNRDSTIRIEGRIDLRDESLALRAKVQPKDVSLVALRSPLTVGGSLAQPRVGVEGGPLARRLLAALALGLVAPPAAVLPLIDASSAPTASPCVANAPEALG